MQVIFAIIVIYLFLKIVAPTLLLIIGVTFRPVVSGLAAFARAAMFLSFLPTLMLDAKYDSEFYAKLLPIFGDKLSMLIYFDIMFSIMTFINWIPIGKPWLTPRLPVVPTIIIMLIQLKDRKKLFYCNTCQKNIRPNEIAAVCRYCDKKQKIKFMGTSKNLLKSKWKGGIIKV